MSNQLSTNTIAHAGHSNSEEFSRYQRQIRLPSFGEAGQRKLKDGCAMIIGVGALGTVSANLLARAGVGQLILVDRDYVSLGNLHRQVIFTQQDAEEAKPKALAAKDHLNAVNEHVQIYAFVEDFSGYRLDQLWHDIMAIRHRSKGQFVIVDGTDNFETRFLINDLAVRDTVPYVYGGAVAYQGTQMTMLPRSHAETPWKISGNQTGCLRCLFGDMPPAGVHDTCDVAGVMGPVSSMIGSLQAMDAIQILLENWSLVNQGMRQMSFERGQLRQFSPSKMLDDSCPCCARREFTYLAQPVTETAVLCGQDAVQLQLPEPIDLNQLKQQLESIATCEMTPYLLRLKFQDTHIKAFASGRLIVEGTRDISYARTLVSQTIGL